MVSALLDGGVLTATELARAARITPQTASTHLAKLTEAGLLSAVRNGRHRHFRLASPTVADMIDGIVAVALEKRSRYRPLSEHARALSAARMCYDHLAGRLSVDLADAFVARKYVVLDEEAAEITTAGTRFLTEFGIELPTLRSTRRHFCRLCLDWTERRSHIAGAIGARSPSATSISAGWRG
jgi:DNA-binding transcriptional ArsR family regulator